MTEKTRVFAKIRGFFKFSCIRWGNMVEYVHKREWSECQNGAFLMQKK